MLSPAIIAARMVGIRLHTNAPHHRAAALCVTGPADDRAALAALVARWKVDELEAAVVAAGGCAAAMRSVDEWRKHPVGIALVNESLVARSTTTSATRPLPVAPRDRPLRGIRVLDCTRILAGPVATRFLAGFGADVLRIDPPGWDEIGTIPEIMPGKRSARLDLKSAEGRDRFLDLLRHADVFVHGYRTDALEALGLGEAARAEVAPGLVDVALNAYGWQTPWINRRGFDSLVQMSAGIADAGMRAFKTDAPKPLPVQALDHATGYLMACAALDGLSRRRITGAGGRYRLSLARTAKSLIDLGQQPVEQGLTPMSDADFLETPEAMSWGRSMRLKPPAALENGPMHWDMPARALGLSQARWDGCDVDF